MKTKYKWCTEEESAYKCACGKRSFTEVKDMGIMCRKCLMKLRNPEQYKLEYGDEDVHREA
jgi:DNA-directed RNA polymerase subunit RPC12/RpoP